MVPNSRNAVLVAHMSHQIRAGAENLKVIPISLALILENGQPLCREQRKRKKSKDSLAEHPYPGQISKLKGDLSSYLVCVSV